MSMDWMFDTDWQRAPPDYSAHVRAFKATFHDSHVKVYQDYQLDLRLAAQGLVRVKPSEHKAHELVVQPECMHVPKLPIFTVR